MSSNLAVVNFTVGGSLVCSGSVTLAQGVDCFFPSSFQGITTTNLTAAGNTTFNEKLPTSTKTPTTSDQLTTKIYVDTNLNTAKTNINSLISLLDASMILLNQEMTSYVDNSIHILDTSMNLLNVAMKNYVDSKILILNDRITSVDDAI